MKWEHADPETGNPAIFTDPAACSQAVRILRGIERRTHAERNLKDVNPPVTTADEERPAC